MYAFSLENFRRSADEVADIMRLARDKFLLLASKRCAAGPGDVAHRR